MYFEHIGIVEGVRVEDPKRPTQVGFTFEVLVNKNDTCR